jgi:hypothetical protein
MKQPVQVLCAFGIQVCVYGAPLVVVVVTGVAVRVHVLRLPKVVTQAQVVVVTVV